MKEEEIQRLTALLEERTMKLMERESELADRFEELEAQKEELTAAVEELIRNNKQLTERNHELDQILYRASHDLRSPISSMFGILNLLKSEQIPVGLKSYCYHLESKMYQMDGVINNLILLGQSTLDEVKMKPLSVATLIEQEIGGLKHLPNFKHILFKKNIDVAEVIHTDELLIRILLRSLLSNSITFRESSAGYIEITSSMTNDRLYLSVADDGEGISEAIAPRIFDMFYRGSEKSVGQGMGLYLVKRIVDRLYGALEWESKAGRTVFRISIPVVVSPDS